MQYKGVHVSEIKAIDRNGNPVWAEKWTKEEAQGVCRFCRLPGLEQGDDA